MNQVKVLSFETLDSTSDEAKRQTLPGSNHLLAIWAKQQTAGHGRYGRIWHSPPGNLYVSLLLQDESPLPQLAQLSFVTAVAAGMPLLTLLPKTTDFFYKWPNDLVINHHKAAGILLESLSRPEAKQLVLGLGMNILHTPEIPDRPVTSLSQAGVIFPEGTDPVAYMLDKFLQSFSRYYALWKKEGFAPIRDIWLQRAWRMNETIAVDLGNQKISGIFRDITLKGELVLEETNGNTRYITAGEIFY